MIFDLVHRPADRRLVYWKSGSGRALAGWNCSVFQKAFGE